MSFSQLNIRTCSMNFENYASLYINRLRTIFAYNLTIFSGCLDFSYFLQNLLWLEEELTYLI